MQLRFLCTVLAVAAAIAAQAQNTFPASGSAGIGTTTPAASALLEVRSTTKGVLLPRMTTAQRGAIASPALGLLVYQTDGTKGFYVYDGGAWKALTPATSGFATRALNNLSSVAINTDLLPGTSLVRSLGSSSKQWKDLYMMGNLYLGGDIYATPTTRLLHNTGYFNLVLGEEAGESLNDAVDGSAGNVIIGFEAMQNSVNVLRNTAVGHYTLRDNQGSDNTAVGNGALIFNTTGNYNVAIGSGSLSSNKNASYNTAVGANAAQSVTSGFGNTALGNTALFSDTSGLYNTATGYSSLYNNTSGGRNTAAGSTALLNNTTGSYNTALGTNALYYNTNGNGNVSIGYLAGYNGTSNSYSTYLGYLTYASTSGQTNSMGLGYNAVTTASNQVRIGNTSVTSIGGYQAWTNLSDGRFKKNVKSNVPGLAFIKLLNPVTYTLDIDGIESRTAAKLPAPGAGEKQPEPSAEMIAARQQSSKILHTGFVAQEVEAAAKKLNYDFSGVDKPKNDNDFYGLRYSEFVVPLVKAVQELDAENKKLKEELAELRQLVLDLKNGNNTLTATSGSLEQASPNPAHTATSIRYDVPPTAAAAHLALTDAKGALVKTISLAGRGAAQVSLNVAALAAGTYTYTLYVDGKQTAAKRLVIVR